MSLVITSLEDSSSVTVDWFHQNGMQTNPVKFQSFVIKRVEDNGQISFKVSGVDLPPCDQVKLLGLTIDKNNNFESHIAGICTKASWHISAIARIAKYLE